MKRIITITFFLCTLFSSFTFASEEILDFRSNLTILENGEIEVTETIQVHVEGYVFKRGIYRTLNTVYQARQNLKYNVDYDIVSVKKNGVSEAYHIKEDKTSMSIYIGSKDVILNPAIYTYEITYTSDNQIGAYDEVDEIYWNVTGNFWDVPIQKASITIKIPENAEIKQFQAFTGYAGDTEKNYTIEKQATNKIKISTTSPLLQKQGITVAVGFTKDIVATPNKWLIILKSNRHILILLAGLLASFLYMIIAWYKVGIDPPRGIIIPLFDPPKNISPAAMRVVDKMAYDNKIITVSLLSLAVKGFISIGKNSSGKHKITKLKDGNDTLFSGEKIALNQFFNNHKESLTFSNTNHTVISKGINAIESKIKSELDNKYFSLNTKHFVIGLLISIAAVVGSLFFGDGLENIFPTLWLSLWSIGCFFMIRQSFKSFKSKQYLTGIFIFIFSLPFIIILVLAPLLFFDNISIPFIALLTLLVVNLVVFYHLLKAPTVYGRKVMDEIEGFEMYLKTAEKHLMKQTKTKEESIQLFERFLPYAVALDCETVWTKNFEKIINEAIEAGSYNPTWTDSSMTYVNVGSLTRSVSSSLTSAVTSSSVAPSSSSSGGGFSGGGGGGFSGGGGGGGGGGGW